MKNKKLIALTAVLSLTAGAFMTTNVSAEKYTIHSGDTLYTISQQFNTTVDSLKEINHLTSDLIFAEDTLEISSNGHLYIIEPGDTLFTIAVAYNVTVEQLQIWNGLSSDLIYAGDTLSISDPSKEVTATEAQGQVAAKQRTTASNNDTTTTVPVPQVSNIAKTMTVESTAYTAYCTGCSGVTADGMNLRANPDLKVIAVDPNVIPLGTKVWVEGYGEAIAADTGGAIKGNKIDVFIPSNEAANDWGRRTVTIKILN
jgi:N-acetylmuramoyl-L-alanine amidase